VCCDGASDGGRKGVKMADRTSFTLQAADGAQLFVHGWKPTVPPRGVVQIAHGMCEHGGRYERLVLALNAAGFAVYAQDHRGHGQTASLQGELGAFGADWKTVVADLGTVRERAAADFPGLPLVLLGHSMGAFLAQQFARAHGEKLSGLVLMGTYREARWLARAGATLAAVESLRLGPRGHSDLLRALTFGAFNRRFAPNRTDFDWLSRDAAAVDRYIADPLCGFPPTVQLWREVLGALAVGLPSPPATLPVCVLVGERDPVCGPDRAANKLVAQFRAAGVQVTHHVYPGARHELLHESNRDDVIRDLLAWLEKVC
jgi:alpha-beta hydrolase superfamily lysophospholipase